MIYQMVDNTSRAVTLYREINANVGQSRATIITIPHYQAMNLPSLRWLDWIFLGRYLPSLSINYVGMSKDIEKRLPQLYYIKMKISYDLGFITFFIYPCVSLYQEFFEEIA